MPLEVPGAPALPPYPTRLRLFTYGCVIGLKELRSQANGGRRRGPDPRLQRDQRTA